MKQLEFFQNALANSVEILLNTEAQVVSNLQWLIESKRRAVEEMTVGNVFNTDDICRFDDWEQAGIPHNAEIKIVAVDSIIHNFDIISQLKSQEKNWVSCLFDIKVAFLRDPDTILKSKAKLTDKEGAILKEMRDFYQLKAYHPKVSTLLNMNRSLRELKHGYNMAFSHEWNYGFNEILDKDIMEYGLKANKVTITKNRRKDEDED